MRTEVRTVSRREGYLLIAILVALAWSAIGARSLGTWALEVVWILTGAPLVLLNRRRFPLTRLVPWLLVCHAIVLCYGGHHTYAQTPLRRGGWTFTLTTPCACRSAPASSGCPSWSCAGLTTRSRSPPAVRGGEVVGVPARLRGFAGGFPRRRMRRGFLEWGHDFRAPAP